MAVTPDHIRSGPDASMPAGSNGYPMWASDTLTFYIWQGGTRRAQASQAWVSGLYAPLASPTFTGPVTITPAVVYGAPETFYESAGGAPSGGAGNNVAGWRFSPGVDGRITKLKVKVNGAGDHVARLFAVSGGAQLATVTVSGATGTWQSGDVDVPVTAGTAYVVSSSFPNSLYLRYDPGAWPKTIGNWSVGGGRYGSSLGQTTIPTGVDANAIYSVDVEFEPEVSKSLNTTLTNYASNAAAIAAGLSVGDWYRQGDFVCQVH